MCLLGTVVQVTVTIEQNITKRLLETLEREVITGKNVMVIVHLGTNEGERHPRRHEKVIWEFLTQVAKMMHLWWDYHFNREP